MVEALFSVAVLAILLGIGMKGIQLVYSSGTKTKLQSDVSAINKSIKVYIANGGSLEGITEPQSVLDQLKKELSGDAASQFAGLKGSMLDKRLVARMQTVSETSSDAQRAIWNESQFRFVIADSGENGVAAFDLDESLAAVDYGSESRAVMLSSNGGNGWIWAYEDGVALPRTVPTEIPLTPVSSDPPTGPGNSPERLLRPSFGLPGGVFSITDYPMTVSVTDPNEAGTSELFYATVWEGSTGAIWNPYEGPVEVSPGQQLLAYAKSTDEDTLDSYSSGEFFGMNPFQLLAPEVVASASQMDLTSNAAVTIEISDFNPSQAVYEVQYKLPNGVWTPYENTFEVTPTDFAATGFTLEARAIGIPSDSPYFLESPITTETLQIKLMKPSIALSATTFSQLDPTITVTISDPNPVGASNTSYKILNVNTGQETSLLSYSGPFELASTDYPNGFRITAVAAAPNPAFIDSDEAQAFVNSFFGAGVDQNTIIVLDTSGSMNWNNRLENVQSAMGVLLSNFDPNQRFALVRFNGTALTFWNWTNATPPEIEGATSAVNALNATGPTNYEDALDEALSIINASPGQVDQVIFLSDGHPTQGQTAPPELMALAAQFPAARGDARRDRISGWKPGSGSASEPRGGRRRRIHGVLIHSFFGLSEKGGDHLEGPHSCGPSFFRLSTRLETDHKSVAPPGRV